MKVLVTGVAGFVGSTLTERLLDRGDQVVGIDCFLDYYPRSLKDRNLARARGNDRFQLEERAIQDLDLQGLMDGCESVYHLAAQAGVRASWGDEFAIYTDNNILATQRLLEVAARSNLRSFVYASSSSVYGDSASLPMNEAAALYPVSPYGVSKLAAEQLCRLYQKNHGVHTVSLRYFTVYGPRQRPDMAFHRLLKAALSGESFALYGDGSQTRDFTFIDDCVRATMDAATKGQPGAVYNIGGGARVSMLEVIDTVERVSGRKLNVKREDTQKGDMRDTCADTTLAERDLGYRPETPLEQGLAKQWAWIQELYG